MEITFSAPRSNKDKEENKEENKGKSQEISETGRITLSTSRPNLSMDNYNKTQSPHTVNVPGKQNLEPCIWCISYSHQLERQGIIVKNPAKEQWIPSSSGPVWECDPETRRLRVQKLLRNECLDLFMPVETRSPNHVSNNKSTIKRNNGTIRKLHQENREYFNKTYGITSIQGNVLLFLDDRGIMFKWSEMERGIHILGINNLEGLANYLYHPDKICRYGRHR
ncbi:unnamed protein product [Rhizophagus irregularis]|nr:unnamed protein product [Rhizophagus irregularis]